MRLRVGCRAVTRFIAFSTLDSSENIEILQRGSDRGEGLLSFRLGIWSWLSRSLIIFGLVPILSLFLTVGSTTALAAVKVVLSDHAKGKLKKRGKNPAKIQKRLNDDFNRGLKELGKKHPGAKALYDSGQTIRIICAKSEEAKKLGIKVGLSPAESHGDFDKKGKPRKGGQTIIAIKCGMFSRFGLDKPFFDVDPRSSAFKIFIHELLHATDKVRRHPPDKLKLYNQFVDDFVAAIAAARKAEEKREKEKKDKKDKKVGSSSGFNDQSGDGSGSYNVSDDSPFAITMGGQVGRIKRSSISFLRIELGGAIIDPDFAQINRNDSFAGLNFTVQANLDPRPIMGKQVRLSPYVGVNNNYLESHTNFSNLSANGNQLGILGPEGPGGPLNGGLIVGAGFGDVTNAQYREYYRETIFFLGVKGKLDFDDILVEGVSPSLVVHGALMYGNTRERSYFGGITNLGTVNFRYNNLIESDRYGVEFGLKYKMPVHNDFGLYANGALRLIHNRASGYSKLETDFNGVPFPSERQSFSQYKFDVGGVVGTGIYAAAGPLTGYAGIEGELWQVPVLHVTGTDRARVKFEDRTSWTVKVGLRFSF